MDDQKKYGEKNPKTIMTLCILIGGGIGFIVGAAFFNVGAGLLAGLSVGIAAGYSLTTKKTSN